MKLSLAAFFALAVPNVAGLEDDKVANRLGAPVDINNIERVLFGEDEDEDFHFVIEDVETGETLSPDDPDHRRRLNHKRSSFRIRLQCRSSYKWAKDSCSTGGNKKYNRCEDWCMQYRSCKSGADIRIRECSGTSKQRWRLSGDELQASSCTKYCINDDGDRLTRGRCGRFDWTSHGFECNSSRKSKLLSMLHRPCRGEPVECRSKKRVIKAEGDGWDLA